MAETQTQDSVTVNMWQFTTPGYNGQDYSGMGVDEFPSGIKLNVPKEGINPHEFATASAREANLQNAWKLAAQRAKTAQEAATASTETARAVQLGINAATAWQDVGTAKVGLQTAQVNYQIAQHGLNVKVAELDVAQYQEQIALMTAPVKKGQALLGALQVQEQFYQTAAQLIQARTDRQTQLNVLGIQGYNVEPIPLPETKSLALPSFEFPTLDQVISSASQSAQREGV